MTTDAAEAPHKADLYRMVMPGHICPFGVVQSMTSDERHAAREKLRNAWLAMSAAERAARRTALQAKWDALPQDQKDAINARIQQWALRRS